MYSARIPWGGRPGSGVPRGGAGGMYSARIPCARQVQLTPPSSLRQAPPQAPPTRMRRGLPGTRAHAGAAPPPDALLAPPGPTAGDADQEAAGIPRIDADGVDARDVVAAAEPLAAGRVVPERPVELPGGAAVLGQEEAAGKGTAPERLGAGRG